MRTSRESLKIEALKAAMSLRQDCGVTETLAEADRVYDWIYGSNPAPDGPERQKGIQRKCPESTHE